jgi:hypothetical protein
MVTGTMFLVTLWLGMAVLPSYFECIIPTRHNLLGAAIFVALPGHPSILITSHEVSMPDKAHVGGMYSWFAHRCNSAHPRVCNTFNLKVTANAEQDGRISYVEN